MHTRRTIAILLLAAALAQAEPANPKIVERYKQMLATNPVEGVALDRLWKIALDEGTTERLIAEYQKADGFASRMVLGHLLRKAGRDDDAGDAFSRAAKLDAQSPQPLLALARLENERGHPRDAADWLEKAAALLPKDDARLADTLMQLGSAWLAAGDVKKAAAAWERTVALDANNLDLRRRLAGAYADNHLPEPAIRHLEFIIEHAQPPERAAALQQIAKLHSAAGRPGEAMEALQRAVAFTAPGNWLRSELLGQIIRLAQRQHVEMELEEKWKKQVEQSPRDLGGYLQLVEFYERTGKLDEQRVWLKKTTALVPKNAELRLKLARLLVQIDRLDDAVTRYDALLAEQPGNVDLVFERARLDIQRDDNAAARARIAALLAGKKGDELLRAKALEFYQEHRLLDLVEEHLKAEATGGAEEPVFALATFYFSQRRAADGLGELKRLRRADAAPEKQAALNFRAAQLLKAQGEHEAAVEAVEVANALKDDVRDQHILLGELQTARVQLPEARVAFERAYALSRNEAERQEVDTKLFETFRAEAPVVDPDAAVTLRKANPAAAIVEGHIRELMKVATSQKSAASWLRVARWKAWNGDKASAVTFALKAVDIEPKNIAPREFLARHSANNGDAALALVHLRELLTLNPDGRDGYLREIGQLEQQRGNAREALKIFEQLVHANPGNAGALADLAAAQERAGRDEDAASTWRKALSNASAPRKREVASSLLRVLQKLNRNEEAATLLLRAVDETPNERERLARFDELLLHARQRGQLGWLRTKFEDRRKLGADDYFTEVALARVLKLLGEKEGAFELFADAVFSAPNQAEALPDLVREAEDLQRLDTAVRLQEQLTRVGSQDRPDGFMKLAALYEKTGDFEGTERTWARATSKFPRDTEVVRNAAEFHQQWGDRARAATLWKKLLTLDPTNVRAASELGELEYDAARFAEAREAFEVVMKLTKPVTQRFFPSERGVFSGLETERAGNRLGTFSISAGRRAEKPSAEQSQRLAAIRRLGEIARAQGGSALRQWQEAWTKTDTAQTTELLWALYFSGARDRLVDRVELLIKQEPQVLLNKQSFVWLAMESGQFSRIGVWLNAAGRSSDELDMFSRAFAEIVKVHPEHIGSAMMEGLFPSGANTRLWPSAMELARNRRFGEAIPLGHRLFDLLGSQQSGVGRELARWHLALGDVGGARRVLAASLKWEGDSFESPVFGVMRDGFFLTPESERATFVEGILRATDEHSLHGLITRVLLFSLNGEERKAVAALDAILDLHPLGVRGVDQTNSASREWLFLLGAGGQLIEWNYPALAEHLWERVFADEGLRSLQRGQLVRESVESAEQRSGDLWTQRPAVLELEKRAHDQWDVLRYLRGGRVEREAILHERGRVPEGVSRLGETLIAYKGHATAVEVYRRVWEKNVSDPAALRRLMDICSMADDEPTAEAIRRRVLDEQLNPGNDTTPRQFALELAEIFEKRGAVDEAVRVVSRAAEKASGEFVLVQKRAQLLQRAGREQEAEVAWSKVAKMPGGNVGAQNALALMLEQRGKLADAIEVRIRGGGGNGDPLLPVLFYKDGRADDALTALAKLSANNAVYAAMTLAEAMGLNGDGKLARSVLVTTSKRVSEPRGRLQLYSKLLAIPDAPPSREFAVRMQARMREIANKHPELAEGYFDFFERYAARFGIETDWDNEVVRSWADGKGSLSAGVVALRRKLSQNDLPAARRVCEQLLARPDISGVMLERLDALFAKQPELRLLVSEVNAHRGWPYAQATLNWLQRLDESGQREKARALLTKYSWLAAVAVGAELLGNEWLQLGDAEQARGFLQQAMRENDPVSSLPVLAGMARVHLAAKNLRAAKLLLQQTFSEPTCREYAALAEYFDVAGEFSLWRESAKDFALSAAALHGLKQALFERFEKQGRLGDALALLLSAPEVIDPAGSAGVTCARLRALARKTGAFSETAVLLEKLAELGVPDAEPDAAALYADWAEAGGKSALQHLERAVMLRPLRWEFVKRLAEIHLAAKEPAKTRAVLKSFLWISNVPAEREAALGLWEKARGS